MNELLDQFIQIYLLQKHCLEVSYKKGVLKNFAKFTGKHLCQSLFFNKFLRTPFLTERLQNAKRRTQNATDGCFCSSFEPKLFDTSINQSQNLQKTATHWISINYKMETGFGLSIIQGICNSLVIITLSYNTGLRFMTSQTELLLTLKFNFYFSSQ